MPKLFDLSIKVEEAALGRVMRLLHQTPGVARVDFDLGDAPTAKSNGAAPHKEKTRKRRFVDPTGATGADIAMKALAKAKEPLRQKELGAIFVASGRSAASYGSVLHALAKEGVATNKGDGYVLTKKGRDRARYVK
jgi:hypothetical protein